MVAEPHRPDFLLYSIQQGLFLFTILFILIQFLFFILIVNLWVLSFHGDAKELSGFALKLNEFAVSGLSLQAPLELSFFHFSQFEALSCWFLL